MKQQLSAAVAELARWHDEGRILPVWWRDDDATMPTPPLERLLALATEFDAPLHLAVIPEPATAELADRLRLASRIFVLPHGWRHHNNAPPDKKKAEFGALRPPAVMLDEIATGWRRIEELFGRRALPIFTPPWNRIAPAAAEGLPGIGLQVLSTFSPRATKFAAEDLLQVNTHVDPVDWHAGGGLLDPAQLAGQIAAELADRRQGRADNAEPYGLLTHHLVQDEATWSFTATLLEMFAESGVAIWTSPLDEVSGLKSSS